MKKWLLFTYCLIAIMLLGDSATNAQSFITANPGTDICAGTSDTFSTSYAGSASFQWMVNSTAVSTDSMFISNSLVNGDTVRCMVISGTDTANSAVVITVHTSASASGAISGPSAVCVGGMVTLTDTVSGGTWSSSNATAMVSSAMIMGMSAGMDTVYYTVTNACGSNRSGFVISVDTPLAALAALTVTGTPTNCAGSTVQLNEAVAGGIWTSTNTVKATVNDTGLVTLLAGGGDTIKYTTMNSCGTNQVWHFIDIHPVPHVGPITTDTAVCQGSTIQLHNSVAGGVWSSTQPIFATIDATGTVTGVLHGATTIGYTYTNVCGTVSDSLNITVDVPALPIIGSDVLCQFAVGLFLDPIPGGTWSIDNFLQAIPVMSGAFFGLLPGNATITYTLVNACGTTTASFPITVVNCAAEVEETAKANAVPAVFPNPNTGAFMLDLSAYSGTTIQVTIVNMVGQEVTKFVAEGGHKAEVLLDQPEGVYFLTAATPTGRYTTRIVIAR